MRRIIEIIICGLIAINLASAQAQKTWKDAAEYEMYSAAAKEPDANKKVAALNAWKDKYPKTDYERERLVLYMNAYEQMKDTPRVLTVLNDLLGLDPKDVDVMRAILIMTFQSQSAAPAPAGLENAQKVASTLLSNLEAKPATVTDADWPKAKAGLQALSHMMLGWSAMHNKNTDVAEQEYVKSLQADPTSIQINLWLADMMRLKKTPEGTSKALFYYARVAVYDGPGALPANMRQEREASLKKMYNSYHGVDEAGLNELRAVAKSQPFPPEGFLIKTATQVAHEKEEQFKKSNPQLALWMNLKKELTGPNGQQYFEGGMKGADVPGGAEGVKVFKATIVSSKPKEIVVGIEDAKVGEITLKFENALAGKAEIGAEIEFSGMPASFTADPFMVIFDTDLEKVQGLKLTAAPAPVKKAPLKKSAAKT